jgi:hypothetical protein
VVRHEGQVDSLQRVLGVILTTQDDLQAGRQRDLVLDLSDALMDPWDRRGARKCGLDRPPERGQSLLVSPLGLERDPEVVVGLKVVWIKPNRLPQLRDRPGQVA